ncbi:hypothetical protein LCGC14_2768630, partial [marine sediment metagenome]
MTHAELVARAAQWLRKTVGCQVVLTEHVATTQTGEIPDAIGWCASLCYLVECKMSRTDLRADLRKRFRRPGNAALGDFRFYLAPKDVLRPDDIPSGWGLYEVHGRRVIHRSGEAWATPVEYGGRRAIVRHYRKPHDSHQHDEIALLVS